MAALLEHFVDRACFSFFPAWRWGMLVIYLHHEVGEESRQKSRVLIVDEIFSCCSPCLLIYRD